MLSWFRPASRQPFHMGLDLFQDVHALEEKPPIRMA